MAAESKWLQWRPGEPTPAPIDGFEGERTRRVESDRDVQGPSHLQNQQNVVNSHLGDSTRTVETPSKASKGLDHEKSRNLQNLQKAKQPANGQPNQAPTNDDRLAELVIRHHLGEYAGTTVQRRLDALFAAPLDQLDATTAALLKACDYLAVTGGELQRLADRLDDDGAPE